MTPPPPLSRKPTKTTDSKTMKVVTENNEKIVTRSGTSSTSNKNTTSSSSSISTKKMIYNNVKFIYPGPLGMKIGKYRINDNKTGTIITEVFDTGQAINLSLKKGDILCHPTTTTKSTKTTKSAKTAKSGKTTKTAGIEISYEDFVKMVKSDKRPLIVDVVRIVRNNNNVTASDDKVTTSSNNNKKKRKRDGLSTLADCILSQQEVGTTSPIGKKNKGKSKTTKVINTSTKNNKKVKITKESKEEEEDNTVIDVDNNEKEQQEQGQEQEEQEQPIIILEDNMSIKTKKAKKILSNVNNSIATIKYLRKENTSLSSKLRKSNDKISLLEKQIKELSSQKYSLQYQLHFVTGGKKDNFDTNKVEYVSMEQLNKKYGTMATYIVNNNNNNSNSNNNTAGGGGGVATSTTTTTTKRKKTTYTGVPIATSITTTTTTTITAEKETDKQKNQTTTTNEKARTLSNQGTTDVSWDERYQQLVHFYKGYGHLRVPKKFEGGSLYRWISIQRSQYWRIQSFFQKRQEEEQKRKQQQQQQQKQQNITGTDETEGATEEQQQAERNNNDDGSSCSNNNNNNNNNNTEQEAVAAAAVNKEQKENEQTPEPKIPVCTVALYHGDRIKKLNDIGFQWRVRATNQPTWQDRYAELVEYYKKNGNTNVLRSEYNYDPFSEWVRYQRRYFAERGYYGEDIDNFNNNNDTNTENHKRKELSERDIQRYNKLKEINFSFVNQHPNAVKKYSWDERFLQLVQYRRVYGHLNIPREHPRNGGEAKDVLSNNDNTITTNAEHQNEENEIVQQMKKVGEEETREGGGGGSGGIVSIAGESSSAAGGANGDNSNNNKSGKQLSSNSEEKKDDDNEGMDSDILKSLARWHHHNLTVYHTKYKRGLKCVLDRTRIKKLESLGINFEDYEKKIRKPYKSRTTKATKESKSKTTNEEGDNHDDSDEDDDRNDNSNIINHLSNNNNSGFIMERSHAQPSYHDMRYYYQGHQ